MTMSRWNRLAEQFSGHNRTNKERHALIQQRRLQSARQLLVGESGSYADEDLKVVTSRLNPHEDVLKATKEYLKLRKVVGVHEARSSFSQVMATRSRHDYNPSRSIDEFLKLYKSEGSCSEAVNSLKTITNCLPPDSDRSNAIKDFQRLREKEGPWQSAQTREHFSALRGPAQNAGGSIDTFLGVLEASGGWGCAMDDYRTILRATRHHESEAQVAHTFNRLLRTEGSRSSALATFTNIGQAVSPFTSRTELTQSYLSTKPNAADWPGFVA